MKPTLPIVNNVPVAELSALVRDLGPVPTLRLGRLDGLLAAELRAEHLLMGRQGDASLADVSAFDPPWAVACRSGEP